MEHFARGMGILSVVAGVALLAFPKGTRRLMKAREEFTHLSPEALRVLGAWELMMGALLVSVTSKQAAQAISAEEASTRLRKAA